MLLQSQLQEYLPKADNVVLRYLAQVFEEPSFEITEVVDSLVPIFTEFGADSNSAKERIVELYTKLHPELLEQDAEEEEPLARLSRPVRLVDKFGGDQDSKKLESLVGMGQKNSSTGGNANETLDRSKEAAMARYMAQERRAKRSGKPYQSVFAESATVSLSSSTKPTQEGIRDIKIDGLDLSFGGLELLSNVSLTLAYGHRYGIVGRNGVGKSTLMKAIAHRDLPIPPDMSVLYVEQEVVGDDRTPLQLVLESDEERRKLTEKINNYQNSSVETADSEDISEVYERMSLLQMDKAEARASAILAGLGFNNEMQQQPSKRYSGGWRMRIAIAQALFCEPELLLLDEPSNHLDLHTVLWLANYLRQWPHTLCVVSHDRDFLNSICTDIIHLNNKSLYYYSGNYDDFERVRKERLKDLERQAANQEMRMKHMQQFVDRFRYNAKRASLAQSRLKAIEKIQQNRVYLPEEEEQHAFFFPDPGPLVGSHATLQLSNVSFGYESSSPMNASSKDSRGRFILDQIDFCVATDSRYAIVGPNGAGKTTFLKLLTGEHVPHLGEVRKSPKMRLGYFSQHHVEHLVLARTPLEHLIYCFPDADHAVLRGHLSNIGIKGEMALRPIFTLSGGQKSRVALAVITFKKPHILALDEPTNHLDIETIDSLVEALNSFQGGIVLVSHDARLISQVCDDIFVCENGKLTHFDGTFEQYRERVLKKLPPAQYIGKSLKV
ncbi:hypothetical protein GAYE_SCF00G1751 [Galdieria yellowstonensis]|uniref:Probable ATP-dependent transporter ycf16 n=1 Tax=Galdieria yellowstonensis TaxID=3028027 RepID=A0AAV9I8U4_9RHOD|nr:hypothetical protein GAYE_SCF00G1751 [Galdieria yellowstonensis]